MTGAGEPVSQDATHLARPRCEDPRSGGKALEEPRDAGVGKGAVGAGTGMSADPAPESEGAPEELVQDRPRFATCQRGLIGATDLPEQLFLGHDSRVEAGDDLEDAMHGVAARRVGGTRSPNGHQLDAVACVDEDAFLRLGIRETGGQGGALISAEIAIRREPDADGVEIDGADGHEAWVTRAGPEWIAAG